jgi:hypothetical protein
MKRFNVYFLFLPFLSLVLATGSGQCVYRTLSVTRVHGALVGTLVDPDGRPIPNADVELKGDEHVASAATNADGEFSIQAPPGGYEIHANARGFALGIARVDVGSDLIEMLRPAHLWMILDVGILLDHCTFTTTSRRELEKAIQEHKKRD